MLRERAPDLAKLLAGPPTVDVAYLDSHPEIERQEFEFVRGAWLERHRVRMAGGWRVMTGPERTDNLLPALRGKTSDPRARSCVRSASGSALIRRPCCVDACLGEDVVRRVLGDGCLRERQAALVIDTAACDLRNVLGDGAVVDGERATIEDATAHSPKQKRIKLFGAVVGERAVVDGERATVVNPAAEGEGEVEGERAVVDGARANVEDPAAELRDDAAKAQAAVVVQAALADGEQAAVEDRAAVDKATVVGERAVLDRERARVLDPAGPRKDGAVGRRAVV